MTETAQTTETTTAPAPALNLTIEIVKRQVPRRLPCKLNDEEFIRISRTRVTKEAERDQLLADADLDAKKRKAQIKEYDDEIAVMRRELHSGFQDRTIKTNEVFEKDPNGNCWIVVYRLDNGAPTGEKWPASAAEMQRHLPLTDGPTGSLLEQATKAQRTAQDAPADAGVPEGLPSDEDDDGGEDVAEEKDEPAESKAKRNGKKGK